MAVPQYGKEFPLLLGVLPSELAATIQVQFQGDSKYLANEPAITASVPLLKNAFTWLLVIIGIGFWLRQRKTLIWLWETMGPD